MAYVAIHACAALAMALDAPPHCLIYFTTNSASLAHVTVTGGAINSDSFVRLVREKHIGLAFKPVDALPGRLFLALCDGSEFLHFGAIDLFSLMTNHARIDIWNRRVRRLVHVFVTERTFQLGSVLFGHVLPVIELDGLMRRFRSCGRAQENEKADCDHRDRQQSEFSQSSHGRERMLD